MAYRELMLPRADLRRSQTNPAGRKEAAATRAQAMAAQAGR